MGRGAKPRNVLSQFLDTYILPSSQLHPRKLLTVSKEFLCPVHENSPLTTAFSELLSVEKLIFFPMAEA